LLHAVKTPALQAVRVIANLAIRSLARSAGIEDIAQDESVFHRRIPTRPLAKSHRQNQRERRVMASSCNHPSARAGELLAIYSIVVINNQSVKVSYSIITVTFLASQVTTLITCITSAPHTWATHLQEGPHGPSSGYRQQGASGATDGLSTGARQRSHWAGQLAALHICRTANNCFVSTICWQSACFRHYQRSVQATCDCSVAGLTT
jgi:hypothetical protein